MRSSESFFILTSIVASREHESESHESVTLLNRVKLPLGGSAFAMFHLDYLSCFLTVLATILLARKCWIGLVLAIINSMIVCAIGWHTLQLGFIPANLFCICVYTLSMRSWFNQQTHAHPDQAQRRDTDSAAYGTWVHPATADRIAAGKKRFPGDITRSTATKMSVDGLGRPSLWRGHRYLTKPTISKQPSLCLRGRANRVG
jgi:hypothetical protein